MSRRIQRREVPARSATSCSARWSNPATAPRSKGPRGSAGARPLPLPAPTHLCGEAAEKGLGGQEAPRRSPAEGSVGSERHIVQRPLVEPGDSRPASRALENPPGRDPGPSPSPNACRLCAGSQRRKGADVQPPRGLCGDFVLMGKPLQAPREDSRGIMDGVRCSRQRCSTAVRCSGGRYAAKRPAVLCNLLIRKLLPDFRQGFPTFSHPGESKTKSSNFRHGKPRQPRLNSDNRQHQQGRGNIGANVLSRGNPTKLKIP